jgi:hypothetical protein
MHVIQGVHGVQFDQQHVLDQQVRDVFADDNIMVARTPNCCATASPTARSSYARAFS